MHKVIQNLGAAHAIYLELFKVVNTLPSETPCTDISRHNDDIEGLEFGESFQFSEAFSLKASFSVVGPLLGDTPDISAEVCFSIYQYDVAIISFWLQDPCNDKCSIFIDWERAQRKLPTKVWRLLDKEEPTELNVKQASDLLKKLLDLFVSDAQANILTP